MLQDVDGVVADMTKDRWGKVDFTQPYVQSNLNMVVPLQSGQGNNNFWIFLTPFSTTLWIAIVALSALTIVCLFYMELNDHPEHRTQLALFRDMVWSARIPFCRSFFCLIV